MKHYIIRDKNTGFYFNWETNWGTKELAFRWKNRELVEIASALWPDHMEIECVNIKTIIMDTTDGTYLNDRFEWTHDISEARKWFMDLVGTQWGFKVVEVPR